MTQIHLNFRATLMGLVSLTMLGLAGCVHVSNPEMPVSWPALRSLATVSGLDGTYRGGPRECGWFVMNCFPRRPVPMPAVDGLRLTTLPDGLQIEALAGETVLLTRVVEVQLVAGAVTFERKTSGHEGLGAASYHYLTTLYVNATGELVASFHESSVGVIFPLPGGSSTTNWWRLPSAVK